MRPSRFFEFGTLDDREPVGTRGFAAAFAAILAGAMLLASVEAAEAQRFRTAARQAYLLDMRTGTPLYNKNADQRMPPASMVKVLSMAVVFGLLKEGRLKPEDEVLITENAWRTGGAGSKTSTMFAKVNTRIALSNLIKGVIIQSGNDACISIAEHIAGSEEAFAVMMNRYARRIGMHSSHFENSTGLPHKGSYTTARDLATLAEHVIRTYPEFYPIFAETEFTWNGIRQANRNPLLSKALGVDGLKTGYTDNSGYGIIASGVRDGQRLILVLNGMKTKQERRIEGQKLLDWGFRSHEYLSLFAAGEHIGEARVFGGAKSYVPLMPKSSEGVRMLVPKGPRNRLHAQIVYTGPIPAPVKAGQDVGYLKIWRGKVLLQEAPLIAAESVGQGKLYQRALDGAQELFIGLLK